MGEKMPLPIPENAPKRGEVFRHYKGDPYRVVGLALNSYNAQAGEDEWVVVYEPMYENAAAPLFARPLLEWEETVEWDGKVVPRFTKE